MPMFPALFQRHILFHSQKAWDTSKGVRELSLLNRKFQDMRETTVNYYPEAVNTLLVCKILKGRLVSIT